MSSQESVVSTVKPPIPYIPEKDELQEAVETTTPIKLTLPTKVELSVSVWSNGTPGNLLCLSNMLLQRSRQRAFKTTTRSLFRPRRSAWGNSKKWYRTVASQKEKSGMTLP
jgi:hypothetical protein